MFKVNQKGTARDGQRGHITEVYTNAVRFLSTTGAHFTLLNIEFTPDSATKAERKTIAAKAKAMFSHIRPGDGFHFGAQRRTRRGKLVAAFVKRIPGYLGIPDAEPLPEPEVA